ncbi:MAG: NAD(P)H-hydrate dehydratase [Chloroflexi bacterium]|nr:NAD(P)H-hydrate dehydratase [Chloroflexota bacterium]
MKVVTVEEMVEMERQSAEIGLPPEVLMENAGLAAAQEIRKWLGGIAGQHILILIGPGNNGGDGLVIARHLHDWGANVHLYIPRPRQDTDTNYQIVQQRGIHTILAGQPGSEAELDGLLSSAAVVVDSLFGTGKARPIEGAFKQVSERVRAAKQKNSSLQVISVDLPSGLNADTGAVDDACFCADLTITFAFPKHGLFAFPGAARVGKLVVADIGIPDKLAEHISTETITAETVRTLLPERPLSANKGTFGRCLVVAGSINYIGAAYLACAAATRVGAGLVTLATARSLQPILASKLTEVTYLPLPESEPGVIAGDGFEAMKADLPNYNVLLVGCGLGQSQSATVFLKSVLSSSAGLPSLILDADALNILSGIPEWWQRVSGDAVLTPHPGEMSRLTGLSVQEIQSKRLGVAREAAASWNKTVILKGAHSIVAAPDGRTMVNPVANPGLASAGTGDVLAGAIAGMAAQGLSPFDAAVAGVFVHSRAGELVRAELGDAGMVASDLLPVLPAVIKSTRRGNSS